MQGRGEGKLCHALFDGHRKNKLLKSEEFCVSL